MNQSQRPQNPFLESPIADGKDIWSANLVNLDELHNSIFQKVLDALQTTQGVFSIAITGSTGTGKTQLFARIRHHLRDQAYCVYINGDKIINLDNLSSAFLKFVIDSLSRPSPSGVMYIQELATALFNKALAVGNTNRRFAPKELTDNFNSFVTKRNNLVEQIRSLIQQDNPALTDSANVIRAILWTLSTSQDNYLAPIALDWLKGEEISADDAKIMKLPSKGEQDSLDRSLRLLRIASNYKPVIICFDELESIKANSHAQKLNELIADYIYTLHNNLEIAPLSHPILILSLWIRKRWQETLAVKATGEGGAVKRLCSFPPLQFNPLNLDTELLNEESGLKLVRMWLERYEALGAKEPFEYVGGESAVRQFTRERPAPRRLWEWCCEAWEKNLGDVQTPPDYRQRLEAIYADLTDSTYPELMDDDYLISKTLIFAFNHVLGETIENVQVEKITPTDNISQNRFQFTIHGMENNQKVSIGVGVCQAPNATVVGTMVNRLIDYNKHKLTRGCLVRSENRKINQATRAYQNLQKLITPPLNGEFVRLIESEITELYALQLLADRVHQESFPTNVLAEFFREKASANALVKEILSDPCGQIPDRVATKSIIQVNTGDSDDDLGELSIESLESGDTVMLNTPESPITIIHDLLIAQFRQPLTIAQAISDGDNVSGVFIEDATNRIFEYQINDGGLAYRLAKFIQTLSKKKMQVLNRFSKQELIALLKIYIELYRVCGGKLEILTNDDFGDEEVALERYGFYPAEETSTPIIYYKEEKFGVALGVYLFWGDEERESLSSAFVDDDPLGEFTDFDDFDRAFERMYGRISYYLNES